ncbi:unnamed protein product, partial [Rotaria sp. Silwood1]
SRRAGDVACLLIDLFGVLSVFICVNLPFSVYKPCSPTRFSLFTMD